MAVEGLRDSLAQGDKRFLRVREIGERVLGVEHYIDVIEKYGTKEIEGTSDTADAEVQNNAWDYAEIYNRLLLRYLKSHGEVPRGTPPIREFWPGTTEMTKMMHAFAEGRSRSFRRK